jgi:hypothetical protein
MIENDRQLQVTKNQIELLKEHLKDSANPNALFEAARVAGIESLIKELEEEVKKYHKT